MTRLSVALALFVAAVSAVSADMTANVSTPVFTYNVDVLGQSGKITFTADSDQGTSETVMIEMDGLFEKDSNGNVVGSSPKHEVNSFASKSFTFSSLEYANYSGVDAKTFKFEARNLLQNNDGSKLTVSVFIFTEAGTIDMDGTNTDVKTGNMKFNVELKDWPFCKSTGGSGITNCAANGNYVDFSYVIKGKADSATKDGNSNLFFLGGSSSILLSNKVTVDGNLVSMPDGYPKLLTNGNKQTFVFRLPKGSEMVYDPVLSLSSASMVSASVFLTVLAMAFAKLF